jgi:adenylate kinase family enzyme
MQPTPGRRIIVTGSSNSGKTTLATRLAEALAIPWTDLDALHWEASWREAELSVFHERIRAATAPDAWVLAGNYFSQQQHVSWPRADTVVFLDLPLRTLLQRCARRTWRRWRTQEQLYGGENRESIREQLMVWDPDHSLMTHIVKTHRRRRREFEQFQRDPRWSHIAFVHLRSSAEIEDWLAGFLAQATRVHAS